MKKNSIRKIALIMSCVGIAISSTVVTHAGSVSALLHADESRKSTALLPVVANPVGYYFTTGTTSKYPVFFEIREYADTSATSGGYQVTSLTLGVNEEMRSSCNVTRNYADVTMHANKKTTLPIYKNCIAGALLYDSSTTSIAQVSMDVKAINQKVE